MGQGTSDGRNGRAERRRLGELLITHHASRITLYALRITLCVL
ncbi:MAG: hypothetical protein LASZOEIN_000203 [Candidatus Fervidibacter sp.]